MTKKLAAVLVVLALLVGFATGTQVNPATEVEQGDLAKDPGDGA